MRLYKYLSTISIFVIIISSINYQKIQAFEYKWPWPAGESWQYSQGWHQNQWNRAIDVASSGRKQVLAAADGVVTHICEGSLSYNVTVTNSDGFVMGYMHIHKDHLEKSIFLNASIKRGQYIGMLRADSWSDGCGWTSQSSTTGHIHWTFQNGTGRVIEGWTIQNYPNNIIQSKEANGNVIDSRGVGSVLTSSNQFVLRNQVVTENKNYLSKGSILIRGDGNGFIVSPSGGNSIKITVD